MSQTVYTYKRLAGTVRPGDFVVRRVDRVCAEVIDTPADGLLFVDGVHEPYADDEAVLVAARVSGSNAVLVG
jgi:hypothetical protein